MHLRPVLLTLLGLCALVACTGGAEFEEMVANQKQILAKLDALDKAVKTRPAAAPPGRPQVDPNKVYKLPVGNSPVKGPKLAKVSIVEFSDFQ